MSVCNIVTATHKVITRKSFVCEKMHFFHWCCECSKRNHTAETTLMSVIGYSTTWVIVDALKALLLLFEVTRKNVEKRSDILFTLTSTSTWHISYSELQVANCKFEIVQHKMYSFHLVFILFIFVRNDAWSTMDPLQVFHVIVFSSILLKEMEKEPYCIVIIIYTTASIAYHFK